MDDLGVPLFLETAMSNFRDVKFLDFPPALRHPSLALRQIVEQVAAEQRLLEAASAAQEPEAKIFILAMGGGCLSNEQFIKPVGLGYIW